jgi:hypothetical protein
MHAPNSRICKTKPTIQFDADLEVESGMSPSIEYCQPTKNEKVAFFLN